MTELEQGAFSLNLEVENVRKELTITRIQDTITDIISLDVLVNSAVKMIMTPEIVKQANLHIKVQQQYLASQILCIWSVMNMTG